MPARRNLFLRWCWLPAALWAGVLWYLPNSGASETTAEAALLVPGLLSVAGLILGVALVVAMARKTGQMDLLVVFATFLSSSPVLSFLLRHVLG